jgi:hypothetical protein
MKKFVLTDVITPTVLFIVFTLVIMFFLILVIMSS